MAVCAFCAWSFGCALLSRCCFDAAQGVKVSAKNLEEAVAGTQLYVAKGDDEVEYYRKVCANVDGYGASDSAGRTLQSVFCGRMCAWFDN
jgi:hypothetical protein